MCTPHSPQCWATLNLNPPTALDSQNRRTPSPDSTSNSISAIPPPSIAIRTILTHALRNPLPVAISISLSEGTASGTHSLGSPCSRFPRRRALRVFRRISSAASTTFLQRRSFTRDSRHPSSDFPKSSNVPFVADWNIGEVSRQNGGCSATGFAKDASGGHPQPRPRLGLLLEY